MAHSLTVDSLVSSSGSSEVGADEPYVLVTAVDLAALTPSLDVMLYGPWGKVHKGDTVGTMMIPPGMPQAVIDLLANFNVMRVPFWGLTQQAVTITDPAHVVFVVSLMEHDDGQPTALRTLVKLTALGSLAATMAQTRRQRVDRLITDIAGALKMPTGAPNFDDVVGETQELQLTSADLERPASGKRVKSLTFKGGNEGTFTVNIGLTYPPA